MSSAKLSVLYFIILVGLNTQVPDFWRNIVFLRMLIPFIAGILLFYYVPVELSKILLITILSFFLILLIGMKKWPYVRRHITSVFVIIPLVIAGYLLAEIHKDKSGHTLDIGREDYVVKLLDDGSERSKSIRYEGKIIKHPVTVLNNKNILLYFEKIRDEVYPLKGDIISTRGYVNTITGPLNPFEFDYAKFMARKNVYHQAYLPASSFKVIEKSSARPDILDRFRMRARSFLKTHLHAENVEIGKALLLGEKEDLDKETKSAFSRSGTMHILAVSGLHVGIIYLLFSTILYLLTKPFKLLKRLIPFLLIVIVWLYTLLTGGSPSTVRAAFMFSLFTIGWHYFPFVNSMNVLAAVAFAMLLVNPKYLFEVGFQLSFAAVAGILIILPPLQRKWPGGPRIWRYFKGIIFMSVAAQLATLPISIFYFNQVPTLGLLANLYAIPFALFIVSIGFIGILVHGIPYLDSTVGWMLDMLLTTLRFLNGFISDLEYAVVPNVRLDVVGVILVYAVLAFFLLWIINKRKPAFFLSLISLLLLVSSISLKKLKALKVSELTVYSLSNNTAVEVIQGRKSTLFLTDTLNISSFDYSVKPHQRAHFLKNTEVVPIETTAVFQFEDETISFDDSVPADILITEKGSRWSDAEQQIITNRFLYKNDTLKHWHFVRKDGAFILRPGDQIGCAYH